MTEDFQISAREEYLKDSVRGNDARDSRRYGFLFTRAVDEDFRRIHIDGPSWTELDTVFEGSTDKWFGRNKIGDKRSY